jgi:hypothetical protein
MALLLCLTVDRQPLQHYELSVGLGTQNCEQDALYISFSVCSEFVPRRHVAMFCVNMTGNV